MLAKNLNTSKVTPQVITLNVTPHPSQGWRRYVDDTRTILKKPHSQGFTNNFNLVDEDINWSTEEEVATELSKEVLETPAGGGGHKGGKGTSISGYLDCGVTGQGHQHKGIQKRNQHRSVLELNLWQPPT